MLAFCFLRNVHDIQPNGKTAYQMRYGEPFNGPIIAFGASIMYKPSRQQDIDELPKMGSKMCHGIFLGYAQQAGGGWSGDLEIMDSMDITNASSVEELHTKRINANEVTILKKEGIEQEWSDQPGRVKNEVTFDNLIFPIIDDNFRQPLDGRKMTRRIINNGETIDTDARNWISEIVPVDPDDVDETETETRTIQKTKPDKKKKAPESRSKIPRLRTQRPKPQLRGVMLATQIQKHQSNKSICPINGY